MQRKTNNRTRKWLTLLFTASLLANVQASVACAMMPDMSELGAQCCCGVSHRSAIPTDSIDSQTGEHDLNGPLAQDPVCDAPQLNCCMVEVSVGINDPPTDDQNFTVASKNIQYHKILKQLDDNPSALQLVVFHSLVRDLKSQASYTLADHFTHLHSPPLYKTTERYRI